ncbi:MAG: recombination protein RecR [Rhodobiaceae bacterium]|jgi:recombination protein RecR|nr:recombination protein RecR [Rhodobiaceae bacterium]|tara:strand:- start:17282 stop:17875 length:594 start_codon:yes stop_codon:yes gene_type:complete
MKPSKIDNLIELLARLPGIGPRSARRIALNLLKKPDSLMRPLAKALVETADQIKKCEICGNIDTVSPCNLCEDNRRDQSIIVVIEEVGDLWALERAAVHKGLYHVLGGSLSAIDGVGPDDLGINQLIERADKDSTKEVVLAMNATIDGQTTAYYITDQLSECNVKISRLARGVPVGGELDYMDDGTLMEALESRQPF